MDDEMTLHEVIAEIEKAYPTDIFPDTTQAERDEIIAKYPGFIDRTSAMMGRHLAKVILEKLTGGRTLRAADEGYCEHNWSFPPKYCPVCNKRVPLIRLHR